MTVSTNQLRLAIWAIVLHCMGVVIWVTGAQMLAIVEFFNDAFNYGEGDRIPNAFPIVTVVIGVLLQVAGGIVAARVYKISAIEKQKSQEGESRRRERDLLRDQLEKA